MEIKLNDISDELLILNKYTINNLYSLDNCSDCIALYIFYYKTAKWQKTNIIKANDIYIKKSLNWGMDKIRRTKKILLEKGLINIIQRRNEGKISGWYVEVNYLINNKKEEEIKIKIDDSNNTYNQQVENSTSGVETINTLKINNKYLKNKIKILEEEIEKLKNNTKNSNKEQIIKEFEELWKLYPKKEGKTNALKKYISLRSKESITYEQVENGIKAYCIYIKKNKIERQFIKQGSTWFNQECWNDDYGIEEELEKENKKEILYCDGVYYSNSDRLVVGEVGKMDVSNYEVRTQ